MEQMGRMGSVPWYWQDLRFILEIPSVKQFFNYLKVKQANQEVIRWKLLISEETIVTISSFLEKTFEQWSSLPLNILQKEILEKMTDDTKTQINVSSVNMTVAKILSLQLEYVWNKKSATVEYIQRFSEYSDYLTEQDLTLANLTINSLIKEIIKKMDIAAKKANYTPYKLLVDNLRLKQDTFTTFHYNLAKQLKEDIIPLAKALHPVCESVFFFDNS
jgi:hypothetical protein